MKLFRHSNGMILSFGFDVVKRIPDPNMIAWSDGPNGVWEPTSMNQAGYSVVPNAGATEFIFECGDGRVVACQPHRCIELTYIGAPLVWGIRTLTSDTYVSLAA